MYSLGVIFYELITGERPFSGSKRMLLSQVIHDEPRAPRHMNDHIPRDLESICLRAMAKEPAHRYRSARALANDLRRFLAGEPILARPVGRSDRLWRWAKRNPQVASLAGSLAVLLVAATAVSLWLAIHAGQARNEANRQLARLNAGSGFRAVVDGDLFGSLRWFAEALRLDSEEAGRARLRRTQFEAVLSRCPRMEHVWFFPGQIYGELSPDASRKNAKTERRAFGTRAPPGRTVERPSS